VNVNIAQQFVVAHT